MLLSKLYSFKKLIDQHSHEYNITSLITLPDTLNEILDNIEKMFFQMSNGDLRGAATLAIQIKTQIKRDNPVLFFRKINLFLGELRRKNQPTKEAEEFINELNKINFASADAIDSGFVKTIRNEDLQLRIPPCDELTALPTQVALYNTILHSEQRTINNLLEAKEPNIDRPQLKLLFKKIMSQKQASWFSGYINHINAAANKCDKVILNPFLTEILSNQQVDYHGFEDLIKLASTLPKEDLSLARAFSTRFENEKVRKLLKTDRATIQTITKKIGATKSNQIITTILDDNTLITHANTIFTFILVLNDDALVMAEFVINMLKDNPQIKAELGTSLALTEIKLGLMIEKGFEKTRSLLQFIIDRPHLHSHIGSIIAIANVVAPEQNDFLNFLLPQIDKNIEVIALCKNQDLTTIIFSAIKEIGADATRNLCEELFQSRFFKLTPELIQLAIHAKNHSKDIYLLMQSSPIVEEFFQNPAMFDLAFEVIHEINEDNFLKLLHAVIDKPVFHAHFASILSLSFQFGIDDIEQLFQLLQTEKTWEDLKYKADDYVLVVHQKRYPERPLDIVISEFAEPSVDVEFPLTHSEIQILRSQYEKIKQHEEKLATVNSKNKLKELALDCITTIRNEPNNENHKYYLLAIIRQCVKLNFSVYPYNVQMLNVLAFLNDPNHKRIAQIKTGEGKSTVVAILATFLAAIGRMIDIITTSHDLAKRDAEKYKPFFACFDLTAGDIATKEELTPENFAPQILYGTNSDFEFAYLREKVSQKPQRCLRRYDVALVDEVDSMFIDMQNNSARMSIPMQSGAYTPPVYQCIWDFINHKDTEKTVSALRQELASKFPAQRFNRLVTQRWFDSARIATERTLGKHYVIHENELCIVDYKNTGQLLKGCEWQHGQHSIIQAKHGLEIKPESATAASISHIEFFNKYVTLYGLTGTLGTKSDRDELQQLYHVQTYDSPAYRPSQKQADTHLVCESDANRDEVLIKIVKEHIDMGQPILILCLTINDSETIHALLKDHCPFVQLYNAIQKEKADTILALAGNPRAVIVATNTAGRGADIVISPQSEKNGGLYEIVIFKTINRRVELQAFGRTGRQGKPGMYRYVLLNSDFPAEMNHLTGENKILEWQKNREKTSTAESLARLANRDLFHLIFIIQSLYHTLPGRIKSHLRSEWAEVYSEIDQLANEIMRGNRMSETILQDAQVKIWVRLIEFWNVNQISRYVNENKIFHGEKLNILPEPLVIESNSLALSELLLKLIPKKAVLSALMQSTENIKLLQKVVTQLGFDATKDLIDMILAANLNDNVVTGFFRLAASLGKNSIAIVTLVLSKIQTHPAIKNIFNFAAVTDLLSEAMRLLSKESLLKLFESYFGKPYLKDEFSILLSYAIQFGTHHQDKLLQLIESESDIKSFKKKIEKELIALHFEKYPEKSLDQVIEEFATLSEDVQSPLPREELATLRSQYEGIRAHEEKLAKMTDASMQIMQRSLAESIQNKTADLKSNLLLLAIIREHAKRNFGMFVYNTQIINVLAFLNDNNGKRIAQIKSGEGKSLVIAFLAAFLALSGRKVDIITTNRDLAKRDADKFCDFFESLSLSVGHNAEDERNAVQYQPNIIYGTSHDFQFAYLQENTSFRVIRSEREYDVVIADEIDSLFIDMQRDSARIAMKPETSKLYHPDTYREIWKFMSAEVEQTVAQLKEHLIATFPSLTFEDIKIHQWYSSAKSAATKQLDKDYIIDNGKVKIVDYQNTGQVKTNSRWDNGLHSLIEAKHGLVISPEDLTAASISQVEYYNKYQTLFGLTGTLGTETDRNELRKLYKISDYDSPSYHPSKRTALEHIVAGNTADKNKRLRDSVAEMINKGRPVLVLTETIEECRLTHELLADLTDSIYVYNDIQDQSADAIIACAGQPGAVLVATNTAGRGADIVPTDEAVNNGGVHTIMTFKAINKRVELQAFARSGRQGKPGTFQYILSKKDFDLTADDKSTPQEIITHWLAERELKSVALSKMRIENRDILHLQFVMQNAFNILPIEFRKRLIEPWAELYTHLENYFGNVARNKDSVTTLESAAKYMTKALINFWNKHDLNQAFTVKDTTILHHAVIQKSEELIHLFAKHCPELLTAKNAAGQIPADLPENKFLLVESKAEVRFESLEMKSEPLKATPVVLAPSATFFKPESKEAPTSLKVNYEARFAKLIAACMLKKKELFDKEFKDLTQDEQQELVTKAEAHIKAKKPKLIDAFSQFKVAYAYIAPCAAMSNKGLNS